MKKILLSILLLNMTVWSNNNARYAGSFTRLGLGARSISMGNSGVAMPGSGYSFYYNPALAGNHEDKIFSNTYNFMSLDRHIYFVGFSMKVPPGAGFSVGWLNSGTANFTSYSSIGQSDGKIDHSANAFYASFSRQFSERFSIGVTIKVLMENISDGSSDFDYSSIGVGGDFGVFYRFDESLSFGVVYKDIGSKLKANTEDIFERGGTTIDHFPRLLRFGTFYNTPYEWLNVAYDFEISSKEEHTHHLGIEAKHGRNLAFRTGLMNFREEIERANQFFAGLGFDFMLYKYVSHLDYAFISSKIDEGESHLFSWEIHF
jgi:hypothetical protein